MANRLEEKIKEMKANGKEPISDDFIKMLRESELVVPAIMPPDTDPAILRQMMNSNAQRQPIPDGAHPNPCIIQNKDGEKFLPMFTSQEQMRQGKNTPQFPISLNLPFDSCMKVIRESKEIVGAVINPFSDNIIFHLEENHQRKQMKEVPIKVTLDQFHALSRQKFETGYLPASFYNDGTILDKICQEKGAFLKEMYEKIYDTEIACPYTEDDFELLGLNISDALTIAQITMPKKNNYPGTCSSIIMAYDREKKAVWYYMIQKSSKGEPSKLIQILNGGKQQMIGDAPREGSEITEVLALVQGE